MRRYGRWLHTGIGTVVGLKLLGFLPVLVVALAGHEPRTMPTASPSPALAADAGAAAPATQEHDAGSDTVPDPVRIPGDGPSTAFTVESRGVQGLVQALRRRDAELAKREAELTRREASIAAAEKALDQKIVHLEALTAGVVTGSPAPDGSAGGTSPAVVSSAMAGLGKIYGSMKAEEAAPLFDRLDTQTVYAIFNHMKQRQISAVLPLMNPDKAVELTELLGGHRRPGKGEASKRPERPSS